MRFLNTKNVAIFLVLILLVGISSGFRYYQFYEMQKKQGSFFVNGIVSLTTLDGYYWIRLAKSYDNITNIKSPDLYRGYPDHPYSYEQELNNLLPYLINKLGKLTGDFYYAGVYLVIMFSSFFIIPVFLYFYSVGSISSGLVSALLTTFGYSYFYRTFLGRVDTDCMNLFFPFMLTYLVSLIPLVKGFKKYFIALILGITAYLFMWWYYYPGFLIAYLGVLVFYLIVKKEKLSNIFIIALLFIIFANPKYFLHGFDNIKYFLYGSKYFAGESLKVNRIAWPNIADFISETQKQGWETILLYSAGDKYIGIVGFIGLLFLIYRSRFDFIPALPVLILGLISFKSGNRFTMYLSPFLYAGLGYVLFCFAEYLARDIFKLFEDYVKLYSEFISTVVSVIAIIYFLNYFSGIYYKPSPSIPVDIQHTMMNLRGKFGDLPVAWTWWDYGYAYQDLSGFSTIHDGGIQGKERAYFVGLSFSTKDQVKMRNIISYFDHKGFKNIEKGDVDIKKVVSDAMHFDQPVKNKNIFVIVSYDMVYKYDGIDFFGKWDFDNKTSVYNDYEKVSCIYGDNLLRCNDERVDLLEGIWGDEQLSKIYIFDENGLKNLYDFNVEGRIMEIVLKNGNLFLSYLLDDDIFNSNFNQLYFLGKYDNRSFEKVYDNFPIMRIYRVK
jgi:dolichyl-diphosphooligosaccharide--protein glycosyltransferase